MIDDKKDNKKGSAKDSTKDSAKSNPGRRTFMQALQDFFFNRKTLLVFSVILSLTMWTLVKTNATREKSVTFTDIPITIRTSDMFENFGLEKIAVIGPLSAVNETVKVNVTGSTFQLSQIQPGDISVVATQLGSVTQPDTVRLALSVYCTNTSVNVSLPPSENYIIVRFDRIKEIEFTIDVPVISGASVAPDSGLLVGEPFSPIKSITLRGPETEMNLIASAELFAEVDKQLTSTETFPAKLIFRDAHENELNMLFDDDQGYVRVVEHNDREGQPTQDDLIITVPVNKTAELPIAVTFKKAPSSFDSGTLKYTISPPTLVLEGQVDAIDDLAGLGKYTIDEGIDLSALSIYSSVQVLKLNLSSGITGTAGLT
ncbi:MAG: hypothetical protein FWE86_03320, partial [Oscillospiraceae bacterium]|nr:hypothetical protein [Oscillospiraceae bacterium]